MDSVCLFPSTTGEWASKSACNALLFCLSNLHSQDSDLHKKKLRKTRYMNTFALSPHLSHNRYVNVRVEIWIFFYDGLSLKGFSLSHLNLYIRHIWFFKKNHFLHTYCVSNLESEVQFSYIYFKNEDDLHPPSIYRISSVTPCIAAIYIVSLCFK